MIDGEVGECVTFRPTFGYLAKLVVYIGVALAVGVAWLQFAPFGRGSLLNLGFGIAACAWAGGVLRLLFVSRRRALVIGALGFDERGQHRSRGPVLWTQVEAIERRSGTVLRVDVAQATGGRSRQVFIRCEGLSCTAAGITELMQSRWRASRPEADLAPSPV
jgi:hypothetical protein